VLYIHDRTIDADPAAMDHARRLCRKRKLATKGTKRKRIFLCLLWLIFFCSCEDSGHWEFTVMLIHTSADLRPYLVQHFRFLSPEQRGIAHGSVVHHIE